MNTARIMEVILAECDWEMRYPRIPEITADSSLDWMSSIDRNCALMSIDEVFGVELPSVKFNAAETVADIAKLIEACTTKAIEARQGGDGKAGSVHESAVPQCGIRQETQGLIP